WTAGGGQEGGVPVALSPGAIFSSFHLRFGRARGGGRPPPQPARARLPRQPRRGPPPPAAPNDDSSPLVARCVPQLPLSCSPAPAFLTRRRRLALPFADGSGDNVLGAW